MNRSIKKIILLSSFILLLSSCSKKESYEDFDLSGLRNQIQNSKVKNEETKESISYENEVKELELIKYKDRKEIISSIDFGKNDPFSLNNTNSPDILYGIKLKGFISSPEKHYAIINYLGNEGSINESSKRVALLTFSFHLFR